MLTKSSDALVGWWGHDFDERGELSLRCKVIGKTRDGYLVQVYGLWSAEPEECRVIHRRDIAKMKFYISHLAADIAMQELDRKLEEKRREQQRREAHLRLLAMQSPEVRAAMN